MNFTTMTPLHCYKSNVTGIWRSVAKRPRSLWADTMVARTMPPFLPDPVAGVLVDRYLHENMLSV